LITLLRCAAIFESFEPLFNLYLHSIVTKNPLNFANCFTLRITKLMAKFDSVSLLNSFSHLARKQNLTNTLYSTSLGDQ
ncbi:hypothetical protein C0J52_16548, partial [Blattella germanica]